MKIKDMFKNNIGFILVFILLILLVVSFAFFIQYKNI